MGTFKRRRRLKGWLGLEFFFFSSDLIHSKISLKNHGVNLHLLNF